MYTMEQFAQSCILLIVLSAISIFSSSVPYLCLLLPGVLFIIFTIRSLSDNDRQGVLLLVAQIVVTMLFLLPADNLFVFLILYEVRLPKWKTLQVVLPAFTYGVVQPVMRNQALPQVLCGAIFLAVLSFMLAVAEKMMVSYMFARNQMIHAVRTTAVNEMYEKKLNQELILKNYLADKNARLEERESISRTIHNSVGHSIMAAIMTLDAADMLFGTAPEKAHEKMNAANERIRSSLESIRHAVRLLDHEGGRISIGDFLSAINAVTERLVMDTMIKIRTDFPDAESSFSIPHEHAEFLVGAVQEILVNGVRHGAADLFTISLTIDSRHIRLSVWDNGKSDFSPQNAQDRIRNGFGLKKLLSYAERCGGSAFFTNQNGFKSTITLPLLEEV